MQKGYLYWFDEKLCTVWSCPNYSYRMGNVASILQLDDKLNREFIVFDTVPESVLIPPKNMIPYFL